AIAVTGAVLSAAYLLGMFRKVALGPPVYEKGEAMWDMNGRELVAAIPLAVFVFWVGFYPQPFLDVMHVSVEHLLEQVQGTYR
ncbi:MAG TPA: NADH-quinone oxidoreductase subunit M, partial [Alphaproteobacteria bacterium]|nr:NADH-quinone oxidoreductase subunit M [Alphaproteobacteria bacterium]